MRTYGDIVREFVPVPVDSMKDVADRQAQLPQVSSPTAAGPPTSAAAETLPAGDKLDVHRSAASQHHARQTVRHRSVLVTGRLESGNVVDVTRLAKVDVSQDVVDISPNGLARGKSNGQAELTFSLEDKTAFAIINVAGIEPDFEVDLIRDVMPVFGKAGCNAGTCHGSKKGKGGLKTSMRGNDPVFEVRAFLDELGSRG